MLYSAVIVAVSAFAGFASAQTNNVTTVIPCCSLPVSSVNSTDRQTWCEANTNTCVDLCGGQSNIGSNGNSCEPSTLQFGCKCNNGTDVTSIMTNYEQTVPALMCRTWFAACNVAAGDNRQQKADCETAMKANCGTLTTKANSPGSSSAAASGSASRTGGGSVASATSAIASGASAAASKAAAASLNQYATPVLAGGLLAFFGMAL